jgi:hypothetical protein
VDQGSTAVDPEEILHRLETELQAELALKRREVDWLLHTGSELIQACAGDGETEVEQRKEIESKVQRVHDTWDRLQNLSKSKANKLHDILQVTILLQQFWDFLGGTYTAIPSFFSCFRSTVADISLMLWNPFSFIFNLGNKGKAQGAKSDE